MYCKIKYLPIHIFKHMKAAHSNPKKECEIYYLTNNLLTSQPWRLLL